MQPFEEHIQWKSVKDVCDRLKKAGYEALLAGGCVRDLLMNREPNDFDVATNATPDQVEALFPRALTVGKAFGVIVLPFSEGFQIEIATFREDLAYKDGRRPEGVKFSTPEADARRRDFTINALFYDLDAGRVIDYVEGERDIRAQVIRTVGDPEQRFSEDKLRLMRAVRFAAQLDFEIHEETLAAISAQAADIQVVSRERVRDELIKLLKSSRRVKGLELLLDTTLLHEAFPKVATVILNRKAAWLNRFKCFESLSLPAQPHTLNALLALFFSPFWETLPESSRKLKLQEALKDLRLDHHTIEAVSFIFGHSQDFLDPHSKRTGEMILLLAHPHAIGAETFASVLERDLERASSELTDREEFLQALVQTALGLHREKPTPFLNGEDLKQIGVSPGPKMGEILHEAYLLQLEHALRDRRAALEWLSRQI